MNNARKTYGLRLLLIFTFVALTAPAIASTVLEGTGSGTNNRWVNDGFSQAVGFTTASTYSVDSLLLDVQKVGPSTLTVEIVDNNSGSPGSTVVGSFIIPPITSRALYSFAPNGTIVLQAGQSYWVRLTGTGTGASSRHDWFGELACCGAPAQSVIISGLEALGFLGYKARQGSWQNANQASYFQLNGTLLTDSDSDGVDDQFDDCPGTAIPESLPSKSLGVNRFALMDGDGIFDTKPPQGTGPRRSYTIADTAGCSCTQIIDALGLGNGHTKFGCSISAMDDWVLLVNP